MPARTPRTQRKPAVKSDQSARAPATLIEHLNEVIAEAIGRVSGVTRRKLLVSVGWAVNDRVFTFANRQGRIVVRLPDESAQRELLAIDGAEPWRYSSKAPPRGWLLLPESMHDDADELKTWLTRALRFARDEGPKAPRRKQSAKARPR